MSEAAAEAAEAPIDVAVVTPPARSKLLPVLLALNSLLLLGVLGVVLLRPQAPAAPAGETPKAEPKTEHATPVEAVGPTVRLQEFVVHLRNPEADRYARLAFEVELGSELDKDKLTPALPKVRDAFLAYLSDRTLEELRGSEGLNKLKTELTQRLVALVPAAHVRAVYITEFVVQ